MLQGEEIYSQQEDQQEDEEDDDDDQSRQNQEESEEEQEVSENYSLRCLFQLLLISHFLLFLCSINC